jgi:hypothetical protein
MHKTIAITLAVCGAGVDGCVVPESTEFVGLAVRGPYAMSDPHRQWTAQKANVPHQHQTLSRLLTET